ncbi:MAG: hypothetical protein EBT48_02305 [Verrucomicrobia bacterium]|nr:hypothetical protein [Verrucomicrobiota bacterium]
MRPDEYGDESFQLQQSQVRIVADGERGTTQGKKLLEILLGKSGIKMNNLFNRGVPWRAVGAR